MCPQVRLQTIEEPIMLPSVVLEVLHSHLLDLSLSLSLSCK